MEKRFPANVRSDWRTLICNKADEVDPGSELCWRSLWIGFCVGHGVSLSEAISHYEDIGFEEELEGTGR